MPVIPLKPSKTLVGLLGAMHVLSAALLWPLAMPTWLKAALALCLLASLRFHLRRDGFLISPRSVVAFQIDQECKCAFQTRDGNWTDARLLGTSFVSPWLTVLNLLPDGQRFATHIVLLPGSLDREDFRQLRVLLRWGYKDVVRDPLA